MEDSFSGDSTRDAVADDKLAKIERILLTIWSDVLQTEISGVHEDFFSLGGDSMAAMRCMNRISAAFGVELSISLFLLESASIAQIALEIARIQPDTAQVGTAENA